ncbi:MAG: Lacal_2735 family protein [Bacteroidetes bacterium]|nr:Lacal_2735 family protein [Bacteroidota bacterium]MDA1176583.1 Lacal_2735 family protein [Bacteroidota bacterium]
MFGLFKRKTETEKLQDRYKKLMAEWHDLSSIDRSASDAKYAEAQKVLDQLDELTL